jgi:hypothetical protein
LGFLPLGVQFSFKFLDFLHPFVEVLLQVVCPVVFLLLDSSSGWEFRLAFVSY